MQYATQAAADIKDIVEFSGDNVSDKQQDQQAHEMLNQALGVLVARASQDNTLRHAVRQAAQALLILLPETDSEVPSEPPVRSGADWDHAPSDPQEGLVELPTPATVQDIAALIERYEHPDIELIIPEVPSENGILEQIEQFDAYQMAQHCFIKARACAWLREYGYSTEPDALQHRHTLNHEAKVSQTPLWMFDPKVVNPVDTDMHNLLGSNYQTLAEMLQFWPRVEDEIEERDLVALLAEAQSALRVAVALARHEDPSTLGWADKDQQDLYIVLRAFAREHRVYLAHLALDSGASPHEAEVRADRLELLKEQYEARLEWAKLHRQKKNRACYHVKQLTSGVFNPEHHWGRLAYSIGEMLDFGLPESSLDFREVLTPLLDKARDEALEFPRALHDADISVDSEKMSHTVLDEELTPEEQDMVALKRVLLVVREACEKDRPVKEASGLLQETYNADVHQLATLIQGQSIVMVGGEPRPQARTQIESALKLHELMWLVTPPHKSIQMFKPAISRKDVRLVLLLIRWSSHAYADIEAHCKQEGKLFVRVPSGYSINMLAHVVMGQVGKQLLEESTAKTTKTTKTTEPAES